MTVVAAVASFAVPHAVQAAPNSGSRGGKGTTTKTLDIATSVSDMADPVSLGEQVTYRAVVSNVGTATAENLSVKLKAWEGYWYQHAVGTPLGTVIYSSVTPSKGSCSMQRYGPGSDLPLPDTSDVKLGLDDMDVFDGGIYGAYVERGSFAVCNVGTLAPGETSTIDVVVRPTHPSRYDPYWDGEQPTLTLFAWQQLADSNYENNSDWESTTVTTGSDVGDCVLTGALAGVLWRLNPAAPCTGLG